jgi:hypothetical protein
MSNVALNVVAMASRIPTNLMCYFGGMPDEHLRGAAADIEREMRYVSAWLTGELTKLEGAD